MNAGSMATATIYMIPVHQIWKIVITTARFRPTNAAVQNVKVSNVANRPQLNQFNLRFVHVC